jgi:hypothetical protein
LNGRFIYLESSELDCFEKKQFQELEEITELFESAMVRFSSWINTNKIVIV